MSDPWRLVREKPGPPGSMLWQWFRLYVAVLHLWREVGRAARPGGTDR